MQTNTPVEAAGLAMVVRKPNDPSMVLVQHRANYTPLPPADISV
ncbi:MAG: hypothetical protein AAFQ42_12225 [Pseudomonadota bacterium]